MRQVALSLMLVFSLNNMQGALSMVYNPFRYAAGYHDVESNQNKTGERYTRSIGPLRYFTSLDSFDLPNRYAYVDGNPIRNIDPSGHSSLNAGQIAGIVIGSLVAAGGISFGIIKYRQMLGTINDLNARLNATEEVRLVNFNTPLLSDQSNHALQPNRNNSQLHQQIDDSSNTIQTLRDQLNQKDTEIGNLNLAIGTLRDQLNQVNTNYENLERRLGGSDLINKYNELDDQYDDLDELARSRVEEIDRLNEQINNLNTTNADLKTDNRNLRYNLRDLDRRYNDLNRRYNDLNTTYNALNQRVQQAFQEHNNREDQNFI